MTDLNFKAWELMDPDAMIKVDYKNMTAHYSSSMKNLMMGVDVAL